GDRASGRHRRSPRADAAAGIRDAEIEHLHEPVRADVDVRRLQIAVDDALGMGGAERRRELAADVDHALNRKTLASHAGRKTLALDVLHDDERGAVVLDDVVDRRDVRMRDARGRARLVEDAEPPFAAAGERSQHALERNLPAEPRIAAEKHLAHAAAPDGVDDYVRSDARARFEVVAVAVEIIERRRLIEEIAFVGVVGQERGNLRRQLRVAAARADERRDRKSTRLNSSHVKISYA